MENTKFHNKKRLRGIALYSGGYRIKGGGVALSPPGGGGVVASPLVRWIKQKFKKGRFIFSFVLVGTYLKSQVAGFCWEDVDDFVQVHSPAVVDVDGGTGQTRDFFKNAVFETRLTLQWCGSGWIIIRIRIQDPEILHTNPDPDLRRNFS